MWESGAGRSRGNCGPNPAVVSPQFPHGVPATDPLYHKPQYGGPGGQGGGDQLYPLNVGPTSKNSRFVSRTVTAVLQIPAAFDANGNAGGTSLAAALNSIKSDYATILTPANSVPPWNSVLLTSFQCPQGQAFYCGGWGASVLNSRPEAALFSIQASSGTAGVEAPTPVSSGAEAERREPTLVYLEDGRSMEVSVQNLELRSAVAVTFSFYGWIVPLGY